MMENLNKFMDKLKKQNPNANWANLLTGVAVLVMVAVFSYAYFTKSKTGNMVIDDSNLVKEVTKGQSEEGDQKLGDGATEESQPTDGALDQSSEVPAETGEKGAQVVPSQNGETAVVQKGEGLWHVAQRVCGDGEKYNVLANANGLNVWEDLNEGMTLKVVCK